MGLSQVSDFLYVMCYVRTRTYKWNYTNTTHQQPPSIAPCLQSVTSHPSTCAPQDTRSQIFDRCTASANAPWPTCQSGIDNFMQSGIPGALGVAWVRGCIGVYVSLSIYMYNFYIFWYSKCHADVKQYSRQGMWVIRTRTCVSYVTVPNSNSNYTQTPP